MIRSQDDSLGSSQGDTELKAYTQAPVKWVSVCQKLHPLSLLTSHKWGIWLHIKPHTNLQDPFNEYLQHTSKPLHTSIQAPRYATSG